ncbi:MAG TPA: hypothetical protein VGK99_03455 [Acidobacteriota bacterium]|jgi:hypothetical protein
MTKSRFLRSALLIIAIILLGSPAVEPAGPFQFFSVTPCRIVDTRNPNGPTGGPAMNSGQPRGFPITGLCGIPGTAKAVALNVTVVTPTADGFLMLYPYNTSQPLVSTINFVAGESALANGAIVPLTTGDPSGLNLTIVYGTAVPGACHVIVDVTGYFQ